MRKVLIFLISLLLVASIGASVLGYLEHNKRINIQYDIVFDSDGGDIIPNQKVKVGGTVTKPTDPTKNGYIFEYWEYENKQYDFSSLVEKDMILKAKWSKTIINGFTIIFDSDGGSVVESQIIEPGNTVTKPTDPTKEGYTFVEWQLDGTAYDFSSEVTSDLTLKANWNQNTVAKYTVTFDSDGGSNVDSQTVEAGKTATKPTDPTKNDNTFVEWQLNRRAYDFSSPVTSNITLKAKWKENSSTVTKYTVTFDSNGGSKVASQTVESGKTATKPKDPTKNGNTFVEWQLNNKTYNFSSAVTSNITLKAVWKQNLPKYTVTFDSNGGSSVSSQTVESGSTAKKPTNPTKNGFTFAEWQLNGTTYNFSSAVTSDITLKAVWNQNISFRFNDIDYIDFSTTNTSLVRINESLKGDHCLTGGAMCKDLLYDIKLLQPGSVTINFRAYYSPGNPIYDTKMIDVDVQLDIKNDLTVDTINVNVKQSTFEAGGLHGSCVRSNSDVFNRVFTCSIEEP